MPDRSAIRTGDGQRDALECLGAGPVTGIAVLHRLGFVADLMRLDARAHLKTAAQDRIVCAAVLVEFRQQAPQRPLVETCIGCVGGFGALLELRHAGLFRKLLFRHAVIEPEVDPALGARRMADRTRDGVKVPRGVGQPVLVLAD